jgi:hypothetical protein
VERPLEASPDVGDERIHGVGTLLRQLWLGLSAYRLFPGSVEHQGFVAAVERIDAAARTALASGPVDVEVRGDRFLREGVELEDDDVHVRKLALVLFERRVERLTLVAVPDVHDLDRLYAALSRDADELDAEGGAGDVLRGAGVRSVELSRVGPAPVEGADHAASDVEPVPADALAPDDELDADVVLGDLRGSPDDAAETLLTRLRQMLEGTPLPTGRAIETHAKVHGLVAELPADLRRSLVELLVDRVRTDPVAERLLSTMSNAELTRALVDLGRDGRRDPTELAGELARAGVRPLDIVDLTAALASGREEAGTIIAGLEQLGIQTDGIDAAPATSVTEAIADYLGATEGDDARAIRAALAQGEDQRRSEAITALGDSLVLEPDIDDRPRRPWAGSCGGARARETQRVRSLASAVRKRCAGRRTGGCSRRTPATR